MSTHEVFDATADRVVGAMITNDGAVMRDSWLSQVQRPYSPIWIFLCFLTLVLFVIQKTRSLHPDGWLWSGVKQSVQSAIDNISPRIPEAFSVPLLGNLSLLRGLPHLTVTKLSQTYGKIFKMHAGGDRTFVILNDIDLVRDAMKKFPFALCGKPQTTTTKMTNAGAHQDMGKRWNKRRHITMSAFKCLFRESPEQVYNVCDEELQNLVKTLQSRSKNGHEPTQDITVFVARSMWRLIYGRGENPDEKTCQHLETLSRKIDDYTQNSGPFSQLDRFPMLKHVVGASMRRYKDAVTFMNSFFEHHEKIRVDEGESDAHHDLMKYMMRAGRSLNADDKNDLGLTEELLYKGVGDLIRAGTESPSLLLLWVCLVLAKYPEAQEKMAEEFKGYSGNCKTDITTICDVNINNMPYTHAVVYETVRFCSLVPFLKRRTLENIKVGAYQLPEGTNIIINNHAIGHDVARWGDPDVFRPGRFLHPDGSFNMVTLETFLPFGIGKRRCMGEELGKLLPFAAIATLVFNFNITTQKNQTIDLTPSFGITLTPQKHELVFEDRNNITNISNEIKIS